MYLAYIEFVITGVCLIIGIQVVRHHAQTRADTMRQTYELFFNANMTDKQVLSFIRALSGLPKPKFLKPIYAISFERYADERGERYFLHTPGKIAARLDELFYEHIEGEMEPVEPEDDPIKQTVWSKGTELAMRGLMQPLRTEPMDTSRTMGAQFKNMAPGEALVLQWLIFPDHPQPADGPDKDKVGDHTFHAVARLGALAEKPDGLLYDLSSVFKGAESAGAHFIRRAGLDVPKRISQRSGTWGFGIYLNAVEFVSLMGWPLNGGGAKRAKRLAPTIAHDTAGEGQIVLGASNSPKLKDRKVAMPIEAGDMHIRVMGGSGTGKSVFLLNLGLQMLSRPDTSFILLEPAGDLAEDMLKRIPEHRVKDVIWFDPLDGEYPIGLNPLKDSDPERVTGHLVGILKNLSGDTWSATIQRVSTAAIGTAAQLQLTFYDIKQLLVNKDYRAEQLKQLPRNKHPQLRQEWDWVEGRPDLVVDSTVNRIEQFVASRTMRNILSQPDGLNFDTIIREHKILLVPLPAARMGQINASAIGSLIREMAWNAAMRQPREDRQRSVVMQDEYQNFAGESLMSKSDPFSEARKYKQQYVIANQYTEQLPRDVQLTVDKNVGTQIVFRLAPEEAVRVKDRYAPLSAEDLANLPRYNVAARIMSSGGLAPTVTLKTSPPPQMTPYWHTIINNTRKNYARPRADVEADILTRHKSPEPKKMPVIGRLEG